MKKWILIYGLILAVCGTAVFAQTADVVDVSVPVDKVSEVKPLSIVPLPQKQGRGFKLSTLKSATRFVLTYDGNVIPITGYSFISGTSCIRVQELSVYCGTFKIDSI